MDLDEVVFQDNGFWWYWNLDEENEKGIGVMEGPYDSYEVAMEKAEMYYSSFRPGRCHHP